MDRPEDSKLNKIKLESGDIIVLATDGLWDNVHENIIEKTLYDVNPKELQSKCDLIAFIARHFSFDKNYLSPYAIKASQHGWKAIGGKPDDITIVLIYVL